MTRRHELERDRQVADLKEVLRSSVEQAGDDGEIDTRVLDGFGDGFEPPRAAWRARLIRQRGSLAVFLLVAALTAGATVLVTWLLRPAPVNVPDSVRPVAADEHDDAAAANAQPATSEPSAAPQVIVVAVVGQVAQPGLVTLSEGARVSDAIDAAGGALPGTDLSTINIARKVADGEQIAVGVPGAEGGTSGGETEQPGGTGKVNINSASLAQLDELPGIGPVTAQSILDFRETNGPFKTVADLANVSGIGPATMAKLADLVTV